MNETLASPSTPNFRTVFVIGLGRSGSTLLGRLLNNHPAVVDVGELLRLESNLDNPAHRCACGLLLNECPDWRRMMDGVPEKVKRNYRKWTPKLLSRVRENAQADVLVDVSKTRAYRLAKRWRDTDVGFILLLRDPRGILRSQVAAGKPVESKLKLHRKWVKRYETFLKKQNHRCHLMYYEDLVSSPEAAMRELSKFIGIDYQPAMTVPRSESCHMALYSVSPYMKDMGELRLDERWRAEMNPTIISRISESLAPLELYERRYNLSKDI
jgi:hypothetical protein